MKKITQIALGLMVVFIATFMLFFIFDSIDKLAARCKGESPPDICNQLNSFTLSMLMILLIISGFVIIIFVTVYIILVR